MNHTPTANNPYLAANGARLTMGLFIERTRDESTALYTLKTADFKGYTSLYRIYMEMEDTTEWRFANECFEGWEQWEMVCDCTWFKPYIARWRKELELKIRGSALLQIIAVASEPSNKNAYTANKLLLEAGWKDKVETSGKRGRPTKDEIKKEASLQAEEVARLKTDSQRVITTKELIN